MKQEHPALRTLLQDGNGALCFDGENSSLGPEQMTSLSLARALAVGCLGRLDPRLTSIDVWDPAAGSGFAGHLLLDALQTAGRSVRYRGQDISETAVEVSRQRFKEVPDANVALGNTLERDEFKDFGADLVIVDAPWNMNWESSSPAIEARRSSGEFSFGIPGRIDSIWLFISLALEKLRPAADGGGRVAALVPPTALSSNNASSLRGRIVEAGLLESVTRLPEKLAPNTSIPLYLLTFTNRSSEVSPAKVKIADLQTQFFTEHRHRWMPVSALEELESGLRTGKPGPRNRNVTASRFMRREVRLSRVSSDGNKLSWPLKTYNDTAIDDSLLESRYGPDSGVSPAGKLREVIDLDPSRLLGDDSRELLSSLESRGWPTRRLSGLLASPPEAIKGTINESRERCILIPATTTGKVYTDLSGSGSGDGSFSFQLDGTAVEADFLAGWLNSDQGISSRRRAINTSSSSSLFKQLRPDRVSLMRWADELIVPVPEHRTQRALASADKRLSSFQAELENQRAGIWDSPDSAEEVVNKFAPAFDNSLNAWLDQLPYPLATALWAAETTETPGEQQRAYFHAWEAIVTFHATVLLSAVRSDPTRSREAEASIRQTLQERHLGIERASFGTWIVIVEKIAKDLRVTLEQGDADEVARVRRAFGDLSQTGIERLISKDIVKKFNLLNSRRNQWLGHGGHTSSEEYRTHVEFLVSHLSDLHQLLGNVWTQLLLVRAGSAKRGQDGLVQTAEVAVGTRSPFLSKNFSVGELMLDGELYLAKQGSQSPLRLSQFVQLRTAPRNVQYTTYFYNRTEGSDIRMVSYQHGPENEFRDDLDRFRAEFGALGPE